MLTEQAGTEVLKRCFLAAGLTVVEHHPLHVAGKVVHLDGFDPKRGVGYEYLTSEAGDREELTPAVIRELEARMKNGEFFILLIDEAEVESAASLEHAAEHFLRVIAMKGRLSRP